MTWNLFRIFREINLDQPFYDSVWLRMKRIQQLIFVGIVFALGTHLYLVYIVGKIGNGKLVLADRDYSSSYGHFTVGTWVIVYIFAYVYKKGVVLQQETELTI